jgi:transcriptional regulator with XRE-family HTH domain
MSQEELARRIGMSLSAVSRWEQGRGTPSKLAKKLISKVMGEYEESIARHAEKYKTEAKADPPGNALSDMEFYYQARYYYWFKTKDWSVPQPEIPQGVSRVRAELIRARVKHGF